MVNKSDRDQFFRQLVEQGNTEQPPDQEQPDQVKKRMVEVLVSEMGMSTEEATVLVEGGFKTATKQEMDVYIRAKFEANRKRAGGQ